MSFAILLSFIFSLAAAQQVRKGVPFGHPQPATALFPAPVADVSKDSPFSGTTPHTITPEEDDQVVVWPDGDDDHLPQHNQTLNLLNGKELLKRAPAYRGTCKMSCKKSPQACQNACYYQNCIRAGQNVQYTEPGANTANRAQAGVNVNLGTPCSTWPFGQRFWDPRGTNNLGLQTDEWPMNTMQRDDFNPAAAAPQVALRCIPGDDNTRGGAQIRQFRRGEGDWNAANGGRFANDRLGAPGVFGPGDWYDVDFYMGDFDLNDPADLAIYNTLSYCQPQPNCQNDGLQFHLTGLQLNAGRTLGQLAWPYDNALHNTYRVTGEAADIRQFHISLEITGQANDQISARVFVFNNGVEDQLASRPSGTMANGASFTLPASATLPRALKVDRQATGCTGFTFTYGDAVADRLRYFMFTSQDSGYPRWARGNAQDGRYCVTEDIPDPNPQPGQPAQSIGTRLMCTFPAW